MKKLTIIFLTITILVVVLTACNSYSAFASQLSEDTDALPEESAIPQESEEKVAETYSEAPPAVEFSSVEEALKEIKAIKAAGPERMLHPDDYKLYEKEYIYLLQEAPPLPGYKQEAVMLIMEGINTLYFTDGYEDQANFTWYKGLENDERIKKLTERYDLKQYMDTKFYFGEMFEDRLIYWWENGDEFRFKYPAKTNVPPEKIIEYLEVEKYVLN